MRLSRRAQEIPVSVTLDLDAQVKAMKAGGQDVISMAAGQPDFPAPPQATAAAVAFLERSGGRVGYTPSSGIPELRAAVARQLSDLTGQEYEGSQVVVTCGAKEALALAMLALVDPGDDVLVPAPSWLSYAPMVRMASANVIDVPTTQEAGFKLEPDALAAAITPKTRALFLNSPSNPTGAVYTRAELEALAAVLEDTDVAVVSDEIYWPFVYEGDFCSPASVPGMAERALVVNGASKAYAMTGWRIGWVGAPPNMARAVANLKSHFTSNASAPAQYAALAALEAGIDHTATMFEAFARRRALATKALEQLPRITCPDPAGAFYMFPNVSAWYGSRREGGAAINGSVAFCKALLENALVAAVPGAAFGEDACIRLSIAASDENVTEALRRLGSFLQTLTPSTLESSA